MTSFRSSPSATRRFAAGSKLSRGGSWRASRWPLRRISATCMSRISASTSAFGTAIGFAASSWSMTCVLSRDCTAWASSRSMFSRTSARSASMPPSATPKASQNAASTSGRLLSSTLCTSACEARRLARQVLRRVFVREAQVELALLAGRSAAQALLEVRQQAAGAEHDREVLALAALERPRRRSCPRSRS